MNVKDIKFHTANAPKASMTLGEHVTLDYESNMVEENAAVVRVSLRVDGDLIDSEAQFSDVTENHSISDTANLIIPRMLTTQRISGRVNKIIEATGKMDNQAAALYDLMMFINQ